jgi:hypothetical protein
LFAAEYGWSIEEIMSIPPDQKAELLHAILYRKGMRTILCQSGDNQPKSLSDRAKALFDSAQL